MTTETNTAPVDDEATATEDLTETPKPTPLTAPVPPGRPGQGGDGNYDPNKTPPGGAN